ncbi:MAG: FAD-binding oxidoreductase [Thermoanaerobaculaceae bacterium]|nr:FAD-binding oxidoreductase [Thermoanaerobaculaceae bacterium]
MARGERRWNGWGFEGESVSLPATAVRWLEARVGRGAPLSAVPETTVTVPPPRPLPPFSSAVASDAATRLRHACGQSFLDLLALRSGDVAAFPDAVLFPTSAEAIVADLGRAAEAGVAVVVRGGGTSVVGGVSLQRSDRPSVVLSLDRLRGLVALDPVSRLATFRAGTTGPEVEAALAGEKLRLGHEPQSFELSTVGGWVATRSAGQRSTGVGKIEELVAGVELAGAGGVWRLPPQPASAAGPELRRLVVGSEGRLGVITAVTLRVRPLPQHENGVTVLFPTWEEGMAACRAILQGGLPVEVVRLSDEEETSFGQSLLELSMPARVVSRWLLSRRRFRRACALLLGWAGSAEEVAEAESRCATVWRAHSGLGVGRSGWRRWRAERFRHPYLRDHLLEAGWGVDTLETAATWSGLAALYASVRRALAAAGEALGVPVAVLCHLSHAYRDGASLYFTFLWPLEPGREREQWQQCKGAATRAILEARGTLSHHHGVGCLHAPYLEREVGRQGLAVLRATAAALDPAGCLNRGVLLADGEPEGRE